MREIEYNARSIPPSEIAKSFIPPRPHFGKLLSSSHTLIVGPRGSGKTTLLKMLTLRGLRGWGHPSAAEYAEQIRFNAAFVPADIAWGRQLDALDQLGGQAHRKEAAFFVHTLRALVYAMRDAVDLGRSECPEHLAHLSAAMTSEMETEFVRIISSSLKLTPLLDSMLGLELALEDRLNAINENPQTALWSIETLPSTLRLVISTFNGLIGDDERRWAILFDELEIAPKSVKDFVLSGIRSFDSRLVIKLAIAPYMDDAGLDASPTSAHAYHDFNTVQLSYANKEDAKVFTHELVTNTFAKFGLLPDSLPAVFASPNETRAFGRRSAGGRTSRTVPAEFDALAKKDDSFRDYIEKRKIHADALGADEKTWAKDVRKVMPIVLLRDYYIKSFKGKASVDRSRKSYALYTGYPSILEITEGNPRAILTLAGPLAQKFASDARNSPTVRTISSSAQSDAVARVEFLLTSLLRVIPVDLGGPQVANGLLGFIDKLGRSFEDRVLKAPFSPDYVSSFILDENVSPAVVAAVGRGLNAGALVHIPFSDGGQDSLLRGLRSQRYRLSYALAARYRLLLTLGGHITLSKLLLESQDGPMLAQQSSLFDREEQSDD